MNFKLLPAILILLFLNASSFPQNSTEELNWITGADVSYLNQMEEHGVIYNDMGIKKDVIKILKSHWFNTIRLRLWHTPADKYCGLKSTIAMAKRVKSARLNFLLDIHHSDTWADPGKQTKPASWQNLAFEVLKDSVYSYTKNVIQILKNENALPDIVQIGNEITMGMLWDDGRVGDAYDNQQQWMQFTELVKSGIQGVKDNEDVNHNIKIMIHIHPGADNSYCTWFYNNLIANGVNFDIIGLSFYPFWGNTLQQLEANINSLALQYQKDIVIVETAYPWSLNNFDAFPNQVSDTTQLGSGYEASIQGQEKYLKDIISIIKNIPDNRGKGIVYYSPEYIPAENVGSSWDNNTLFGPKGDLLTSIDAFNPEGINRISLSVNNASIPDTLNASSFFELRGSVNGVAPFTLPDNNVIDWSENSTIELEPINGDYFTKTFYAPNNSEIHFKFWSQEMVQLGTNGWESGVTGTNQTGDMFLTLSGDTILPFHFFNGLGEQKSYNWRLWQPKSDSIAVWFRVYMYTVDAVSKGYHIGEGNIIGIRGDPLDGVGPLSWDDSKKILNREISEQNAVGYHLFSGVVFYPKSLKGKTQKYKFFIEPNGWENGDDRLYTIPVSDSTIHWVYYSNSTPYQEQVNVKDEENKIPINFSLAQNYPNPFNPTTTIKYSIHEDGFVIIKVYNIVGGEIATLVNEEKSAGVYKVKFDGSKLSSGIYFYRIQSGNFVQTKKLILLK